MMISIDELLEEQRALLLEYRVALNNANKSSQEVVEKLSDLLDNAKEDGEDTN